MNNGSDYTTLVETPPIAMLVATEGVNGDKTINVGININTNGATNDGENVIETVVTEIKMDTQPHDFSPMDNTNMFLNAIIMLL